MPNIQFQFLTKKQWPYAKVAKFLHRQMQKRDVIVSGWNLGFTLGQFFDRPQDQIMLPNDYVNRVANHLDAPAPGRVFYVTGLRYFKRSQGAGPTFRRTRSDNLPRRYRAGIAPGMER